MIGSLCGLVAGICLVIYKIAASGGVGFNSGNMFMIIIGIIIGVIVGKFV